jgi:DNA-binding NtrC family response regulator
MSTPAGARILVADDEPSIVSLLSRILTAEGHTVVTAAGGEEACAVALREQPHLVLVDLTMPDRSGLDVLRTVKERSPGTTVIIMTAYASAESAVEAMKQGALDYLIKPIATDELKIQVRRALAESAMARENRALKEELGRLAPEETIIGQSAALRAVLDMVGKVAGSDATVLVTGETGTGKELVARAIHRGSAQRAGPFLAVNCGALSEGVLERELFGHEKGAFTGADTTRPGLLEAAADGTMLLDEIGEMSPGLQVKLLRVLEGREFMRVGGTRPLACRARFVAATNKDLGRETKEGRFRQDLYYRLHVMTIALPPLRDREADVHLLANWFLQRVGKSRGRNFTLSPAARDALQRYRWPGNVRELRNVLERATMLAASTVLEPADLLLETSAGSEHLTLEAWCALPHQEAKEVFERYYLARALKTCGGNISRTAERFGLDRKNLEDKIKRYDLKPQP